MQYGNPAKVWLSLGSNVGDRKHTIECALKALSQNSDITVRNVSSLYETEPWGLSDQPKFYNLAVEIETALEPLELLNTTKLIEHQLGRKPGPKWGPRVLDIDIILWGTEVLDTPDLTIPHPRFRERAFVLVPLCEIADSIVDPHTGHTVAEMHRTVEDKAGVARVDATIEFQNTDQI